MPSVLPLVVRTSFRFNGRFHNDRFVTLSFLKRRTPQEQAEHPKNTPRTCHKTKNWRLNTSNIPRISINYPQHDFDHLFTNSFGAGRAIFVLQHQTNFCPIIKENIATFENAIFSSNITCDNW